MQEKSMVIKSKHAGIDLSSTKIMPIARYIKEKKVSGIIYHMVKSAIANGESNLKLGRQDLYVKDVIVGQGRSRKWRRFRGKGSMNPILRRTSNVTILLDIKNESKN